MKKATEVVTSTTTSLVVTAASAATSAAINYGVSIAIAPFVGPVGATIAPRLFAQGGQAIATSAAATVITHGIMTCLKSAANQVISSKEPPKATGKQETKLSEEWDDADVPLERKPGP